jgi:hypothetical protein
MRTPKIEALHRAINWYNTYDILVPHIECLSLDNSPINSNVLQMEMVILVLT